jgi:hypothetical protein
LVLVSSLAKNKTLNILRYTSDGIDGFLSLIIAINYTFYYLNECSQNCLQDLAFDGWA